MTTIPIERRPYFAGLRALADPARWTGGAPRAFHGDVARSRGGDRRRSYHRARGNRDLRRAGALATHGQIENQTPAERDETLFTAAMRQDPTMLRGCAARRPHAPAIARRARGAGTPGGRGKAAASRHREASHPVDDPLGSARKREDHARAHRRRAAATSAPLRPVQRGARRRARAAHDPRRGDARARLRRQRTILFVDEIHRFNKAQQDAFLPHVEDGTVTLIGATTENPSFAVNAALLSRCKVFRLEALSDERHRSTPSRARSTTRRAASAPRASTADDEALDAIAAARAGRRAARALARSK